MTAQEIFTKVVVHLLTQKQVATADGQCRYRTAEGLSCAVGCLIPDEFYDERMEGRTVVGLLCRPSWQPQATTQFIESELRPHYALLVDLQDVHDNAPPEMWAPQLRQVARNHELNMPEMPA